MQSRGHEFSPESFDTTFRGRDWLSDRVMRTSLRGPVLETLRQTAIHLFPPARHRYRALLTRNLAMIESICEITGGTHFLDGSKDAVRLRYLLESAFPDARVIFLLRDGRGQACSYMRHYNVPMKIAAKEWVHTQLECRRVLAAIPESQCLRVIYEDLCRDPERIMGEIYDFLGLDSQLGSLTYSAKDHHILGNSMRLREIKGVRQDERWRKDLNREDLAAFEAIAGDHNRSLGYHQSEWGNCSESQAHDWAGDNQGNVRNASSQ
ncbi:MAG: putative exported protein [Verrucomicrobiales bacterium]|nr:putative exported protein [Verrucomicrobiales bacterium]